MKWCLFQLFPESLSLCHLASLKIEKQPPLSLLSSLHCLNLSTREWSSQQPLIWEFLWVGCCTTTSQFHWYETLYIIIRKLRFWKIIWKLFVQIFPRKVLKHFIWEFSQKILVRAIVDTIVDCQTHQIDRLCRRLCSIRTPSLTPQPLLRQRKYSQIVLYIVG